MPEAWIIDAVRTPRGHGKLGKGALAKVHPQRLLSTALRALQTRNQIETRDVDDVIAGCATQSGKQSHCIARMAVLDAGWSKAATGMTVHRFCGSGLSAVNLAAMGIMSGQQDLVIAGGVESMSHTSSLRVSADGLDSSDLMDAGNLYLRALHPQSHQGVCADLIASIEGITRAEADELGYRSHMRAVEAMRLGRFNRSLVPVHDADSGAALEQDELPRPDTTLEALAALKPAFEQLGATPIGGSGPTYAELALRNRPSAALRHVHHAGNSSGIADGAAALLLASAPYARAHGWAPRARVLATANAGDDPDLMLTAPSPAARRCLSNANMLISDIDLIEINEAFAAIPLKFMRDLDLDPRIVNVNGGAIALGHPIGATGAMLLGTLLDELERRDLNTGLVTMCTGGGMAPCTIIERL
jgi:acetyl-CoA C-acetyltransferase